MRKNSKSLFVLIPLVAIIWGLVIYKIVETLSDETTIVPATKPSVTSYKRIVERDTFSLINLDRDPFLGKMYTEKPPGNIKATPVKKTLEWPGIEYHGLVSDTDAKSKIYLLKINGKSFFIKEGSTAESVRLVKGSVNKVWLRYKGVTKVLEIS